MDAPAGLPGLDVSYVQGRGIDWKKAKAAGLAFAYAKASEGITVTDGTFERNWSEMGAAGLTRGAYLFLHPEDEIEPQVHTFCQALGQNPLGPGDLPPAIDIEITGKRSAADIGEAVHACGEALFGIFGVVPMVYCSPYWEDQHVAGADLSWMPLWVAHYEVKAPVLPKGWTRATIWQWTGSGRWPGVAGAVDVNAFLGSSDELADLAAGSDPIPATQPGGI